MATRKSSSATKGNSATKRQQSTSSTRDEVHPDAVAALGESAELLWILEQLQSNAKSTQCCLDDHAGVRTYAESAAELTVPLADALLRLQGFLSDEAIELLEAANDNRLVDVENRLYPSYCYAVFHLGMTFYFNSFAGERKWITSGVAPNPVHINGKQQWQFEIGFDPKRFSIPPIERDVIIEHWGTISNDIVDTPHVSDPRTLGNRLVFEKKRLLQLIGEDSNYQPAINLCRLDFDTYKHFKAFLRKFPEIRTRKPSKNRLLVHAVDYTSCRAKLAAQNDEKNISQAFLLGVQRRLAEIREKKKR